MNANHQINWDEVVSAVLIAEDRLGPGKGRQKRRWAVQWLLNLINIPGLPRWAETWIFGQCIDLTVYLFNRLFSHQWRKRVKRLLVSSDTETLSGGLNDD